MQGWSRHPLPSVLIVSGAGHGRAGVSLGADLRLQTRPL